jgi:hypothetical protein
LVYDFHEIKNIFHAINDETSSTLGNIRNELKSTDNIDELHYQAIFSINSLPSSILNDQNDKIYKEDRGSVQENPPKVEENKLTTELYKTIKRGDIVLAQYPPGDKFYRAEVISVIHGGYISAKYDVKFLDTFNNTSLITLSWKNIKNISNINFETKEAIGREIVKIITDTNIDQFGRNVSDFRQKKNIVSVYNNSAATVADELHLRKQQCPVPAVSIIDQPDSEISYFNSSILNAKKQGGWRMKK